MSETNDPDSRPTEQWSTPGGTPPAPPARPTDSQVDGMLGASPPRTNAGWQPPSPEELQARLPQYEIRELIGRGGMGAVYKGWQKSLDRFVAIKILPPGLVSGEIDFAARFKREAKAMAKLKHAGIIPVHDAGETADGLLYFVMDFVEGTDLQKMLATRGRLPPEEALPIITRVLDALGYAHKHGIIHRDIKPANIMVDEEGNVLVADFGLARSTAPDTTMLTMSNMAMGTPDFMAPESHLGMDHVDHRADLYAVGVMLYQMLTGKLPRGRFDPPSKAVPGLDKRLDRIVDRTLMPERDARYSSAIELRGDLQPVVTRVVARSSAAAAKARPRGRKPIAIFAAIVFCVIGVSTILVYQDSTRDSEMQKRRLGHAESESGRPRSALAQSSPSPAGSVGVEPFDKLAAGSAASSDGAVPAWHDAFSEPPLKGELSRADHTAEGYLFPNNNWIFSGPATTRGAVRATASVTGGAIALVFSIDGSGHYYRASANPESKRASLKLLEAGKPEVQLGSKDGLNFEGGPSYEFSMVRVGGHWWVLMNGKVIMDAGEPDPAPARMGLQTDERLRGRIQKVEYITLDGTPEAEALKLAGVSAPAPQWHDALAETPLKEVIAKADRNARGWLLPSGNHWSVTPFLQTGAIRVRATLEAGRFLQFQAVSVDGQVFSRTEVNVKVHKAFTYHVDHPQPDQTLGEKENISLAYDRPCEFMLARIGGRLWTVLDGQVLLQPADPQSVPVRLVLGCERDCKARFEKVEYLNLDGVPEAEALKLAGVSSAPSPQVSASSPSPTWQPAFGKPLEQLATTDGARSFKDGWLILRGGMPRADTGFGQGAARVRVAWLPQTQTVKLGLSGTDLELHLETKGEAALLCFDGKGYESDPPTLKLSVALTPGSEATLQLAWFGGRVHGWVNGQSVGSQPLHAGRDHVTGIHFSNDKNEQQVRLRDFEVLPLDGLPEAEALKLAGAAKIDAALAVQTFGGHRYQLVKEQLSWPAAKARAESMGGHLATVTTHEENGFIRYQFGGGVESDQGFWIGAKTNATGSFEWITGEPFAITGWLWDQPDRKATADSPSVLRYWRRPGNPEVLGWDDVDPAASPGIVGFLVEWDDAGKVGAVPAAASKQ